MTTWLRSPWTVRCYALLVVVGVIYTTVRAHGSVIGLLIFLCIVAVWLKYLIEGSRLVWLATLALSVLGLLADLTIGSFTLFGIVLGVAALTLLLLPASRSYFDPSAHPDS
jgi:hypothetical protein